MGNWEVVLDEMRGKGVEGRCVGERREENEHNWRCC
jgi:hypothetical protein